MSGHRKRNRRNKNRQHDKQIEARAKSAEASGLKRTDAVPGAAQDCPNKLEQTKLDARKQAEKNPQTYHFCNLTSLTVKLSGKLLDKPVEVVVDRRRVDEQPAASAEYYKDELGKHDIIMEVLSTARDMTTVRGGERGYTEGKAPVHAEARAIIGPRHTDDSPPHPLARLDGGELHAGQRGGGSAQGDLIVPNTSVLNPGTWGRFWPFGRSAATSYVASAEACGNVAAGAKRLPYLSVEMFVMPMEEYTLTLGLAAHKAATLEAERNKVQSQLKLAYSKERRGVTESDELTMKDDGSSEEEIGKSGHEHVGISVYHVETTKQASILDEPEAEDPKYVAKVKKLKFQRKIAGQEVETDVGETINKILQIEEIFHDISKLLDGVKIGWSVKLSYVLLEGNLVFNWGKDWPASYAETDRVYYVKQFVSVSGDCTLVSGAVEGMCGIDIDPWWLPGSIVGKIFLNVEASIAVGATFKREWTNQTPPGVAVKSAGRDLLGDLHVTGKIEPKLGVSAGGSIAGVKVLATASIEGKLTLTGKGGVSMREGPFCTSTLESEPIAAKIKVTRVGGREPDSYETKPFVICHLPEGWKDRPLCGGKSREGS